MKTKLKTIALVLVLGTAFTACNKNDDSDTTTAQDNALAESTYDDANDIADQAAKGTLSMKVQESADITSTCAMFTYDTVSSPRVLTVDFGTTNCLCSDGKYRRGKIIVTHTGRYRDPGTVITIGFQDYFVNDNHVEGSRVVTNNGMNGNNNISFSVVVNGTITKTDGTVSTWTSNRIREWVAGYDTQVRADDQYSVTGTANGTRSNGNSYTATTVTPLLRKVECHQFVSGTVNLTITGKADRSIDFGNGDCDDLATVSIGSITRTITIN